MELLVPVQKLCKPETQGGRRPGNPAPGNRDTPIEHTIQGVTQVLVHDDGAVDSELEVGQGVSDERDDPLHPIDLLFEEDVHWHEGPHLLETVAHLEGDVVHRELVKHVISHAGDGNLTRLSTSTPAVLWLDTEDGSQHGPGSVTLISE